MCSTKSIPACHTRKSRKLLIAIEAPSTNPHPPTPIPLLSETRELVDAVEGGGLVALGERRVVEDRVDEVVNRALQGHHGLADVQNLGRALADDVDAEYLARLAVEDDLQASGGVAAYLAAGYLAVVCDADLVGHVLVRQLLLGLADEGDFRNGVDAVRVVGRVGLELTAEGEAGGDAPLLHRDRGEGGEADHVADGVDVRLLRPVLRVHADAPARGGFESGGGEVQIVNVALPPDGVEQRVARNFLVALQVRHDASVRHLLDRGDLFVEPERDAVVSQVVAERLDNLLVCEAEELC